MKNLFLLNKKRLIQKKSSFSVFDNLNSDNWDKLKASTNEQEIGNVVEKLTDIEFTIDSMIDGTNKESLKKIIYFFSDLILSLGNQNPNTEVSVNDYLSGIESMKDGNNNVSIDEIKTKTNEAKDLLSAIDKKDEENKNDDNSTNKEQENKNDPLTTPKQKNKKKDKKDKELKLWDPSGKLEQYMKEYGYYSYIPTKDNKNEEVEEEKAKIEDEFEKEKEIEVVDGEENPEMVSDELTLKEWLTSAHRDYKYDFSKYSPYYENDKDSEIILSIRERIKQLRSENLLNVEPVNFYVNTILNILFGNISGDIIGTTQTIIKYIEESKEYFLSQKSLGKTLEEREEKYDFIEEQFSLMLSQLKELSTIEKDAFSLSVKLKKNNKRLIKKEWR